MNFVCLFFWHDSLLTEAKRQTIEIENFGRARVQLPNLRLYVEVSERLALNEPIFPIPAYSAK